MMPLIYSAIAIVFLLLVLVLSRRATSHRASENFPDLDLSPKIDHGLWLHLSDRIFDPSDARWLAEELSLPNLAQALTLDRKRLAIFWLESLQSSFDEFVRTPQQLLGEVSEAESAGGWRMLWYTLRFKISIFYALLMVKWFGPYHRLIPSFSWMPFSQKSEHSFRRTALANSRSSH